MRSFTDGQMIVIEPWKTHAFPVLKDVVVDRSAYDRILQAGGFVSVSTGSAPDGNAIPVPKEKAELAMDAAACIGCGACAAACPKDIKLENIARLNRDYLAATVTKRLARTDVGGSG